VIIAWWAMMKRINQHGLTEDRIWGLLVLVIASSYVTGYVFSLRDQSAWMKNIGKTNVVVAIMLCIGLLLLLSPLADARRIAVNNQMARLVAGAINADALDYQYLRWKAGRYGKSALTKLEEGIDHKERDMLMSKAKQALAETYDAGRYGQSERANISDEELRKRIAMFPSAEKMDERFLKIFTAKNADWRVKQCLATDGKCAVWSVDLDKDGKNEYMLIASSGASNVYATLYQLQSDDWKVVAENRYTKDYESWIRAIEKGRIEIKPAKWPDLSIDGLRIPLEAK
jgi:hypothetical protein